MARPSKPVSVIIKENKSHRTKKELASRQRQEDTMETGKEIRKLTEVKNNRKASLEFDRVTEILDEIDKNDRAYETVINRYCMIISEVVELQKFRKTTEKTIKDMTKLFKENILTEVDDILAKAELSLDFAKEMNKMSKQLVQYDIDIDQKRKMLLAIEKESGMTMAAMLRTVDKKPEQTKNPLLEILEGG